MNFWATIEHSLNYKYKKNIPENVKERLKKSAEAAAKLDQEMCEIRNEIIRAQLMFEDKSNTVRDITDNIQLLNSANRHEEAIIYQNKFDRIWESGDNNDLEELLLSIKEVLPRYQIFKDEE